MPDQGLELVGNAAAVQALVLPSLVTTLGADRRRRDDTVDGRCGRGRTVGPGTSTGRLARHFPEIVDV